jgi:hypothetical protein
MIKEFTYFKHHRPKSSNLLDLLDDRKPALSISRQDQGVPLKQLKGVRRECKDRDDPVR